VNPLLLVAFLLLAVGLLVFAAHEESWL